MKEIKLSDYGKKKKVKGQYVTFVDDDDFDYLTQRNWSYLGGYAKGRDELKNTVYMHRVIMKATKGFEVDHIDGNKLNNQKSNLRICTSAENKMNKGAQRNNKSGYKGVCWNSKTNKWQAQIKANRVLHNIGFFSSKEEAYAAYCKAAEELHGQFAHV